MLAAQSISNAIVEELQAPYCHVAECKLDIGALAELSGRPDNLFNTDNAFSSTCCRPFRLPHYCLQPGMLAWYMTLLLLSRLSPQLVRLLLKSRMTVYAIPGFCIALHAVPAWRAHSTQQKVHQHGWVNMCAWSASWLREYPKYTGAWERELAKWAPGLEVLSYIGTEPSRAIIEKCDPQLACYILIVVQVCVQINANSQVEH